MIPLVLADDSFLVRRGLRAVVEAEPELELVGECVDLASLLATVDTATPDVVITDIRMPPTATDEGIHAAVRLRRSHPTVRVSFSASTSIPDMSSTICGTAPRVAPIC